MSRVNARPSTSKFNISSISPTPSYTSSSCLITPSKHRLNKYIPLSKHSSRELHKTHILSRDNISYPSKPKDENLLQKSLKITKQHRESRFISSRSDTPSVPDSAHLPHISLKDKSSNQLADMQHMHFKRIVPIDSILLPKYKTILEHSHNFLNKLHESYEGLRTPKSANQPKRLDYSGKILDEGFVMRSFSREASPSGNPIRLISITSRNRPKAKEFKNDLFSLQPIETNFPPRPISVPQKSSKQSSHNETQTDLDTESSDELNINITDNYCISEDDSAEEESPTVRYKSRYNVFK